LKKWVLLGVGVTFIFIFLTWQTLSCTRKEMEIQDFFQTDFSKVTKIEVRYSDGNLLKIEDPSTINTITSTLSGIRLHPLSLNSPVPAGFLYYMDLTIASRTVRYSRFLNDGDTIYQSTDPQAKQLDDLILKLGKEKIPQLLPGLMF